MLRRAHSDYRYRFRDYRYCGSNRHRRFRRIGTGLFVCPPVFGTVSHRGRMRIGLGPIIRTPLRLCLRHCPSANALQPL